MIRRVFLRAARRAQETGRAPAARAIPAPFTSSRRVKPRDLRFLMSLATESDTRIFASSLSTSLPGP